MVNTATPEKTILRETYFDSCQSFRYNYNFATPLEENEVASWNASLVQVRQERKSDCDTG